MSDPTLDQLLTLAKVCGLNDAQIHENDGDRSFVKYRNLKAPYEFQHFDPLHNPADLVLVMKAMHEWARHQETECRSGYWFDDAYGGADHWYVNFLPDIKGTGQTFESAWHNAALKWSTIVEKEKKDELG